MKESRVSKMEKSLDIRAVSQKVNEHGHVERNEIHASKCDFLFGLNLDSPLSSSGNTADDHDTFCSAIFGGKSRRKTKKTSRCKRPFGVPRQISLLHLTTRSGVLHLHIVGTRLAVVYILETVFYTVSTPGILVYVLV
jgi:hypothetical protein